MRIFSDSWAAYRNLNDEGFQHFNVSHKTNFKAVYKNLKTNGHIECCTKNIEGAWKHAKDHFKRINGCGLSTFEGHLSKVVWRNHVKYDNIYYSFYTKVCSIYTLDKPPTFHYSTPLWTGNDVTHRRMSFVPEGSDVEKIYSPPPETSSSSEPDPIDFETPPYVSDTNTPDNQAEQPDLVTQLQEVCHRYIKKKMLTLSLKKSPTASMDNEKSPILINTSSDNECESTSHEQPHQNINVRKR